MDVSLTNELETFVDDLVARGNYESASDVVRESLRLLKAHENLKAQKLSDLRAEVLAGYEQAKRGESRPLDTEAIKAEGRRRLDTLPLED